MFKEIYKIDEEGFKIDFLAVDFNEEGTPLEELPKGYIIAENPHNFRKAKWTGTEWIEGESQEEKDERESQQLIESLKPSQDELSDAELEIKIITLLSELEVI